MDSLSSYITGDSKVHTYSIEAGRDYVGSKYSDLTVAGQYSAYDMYDVEQGFTQDDSKRDQVSLSSLGKELSRAQQEAEQNREVFSEDSVEQIREKTGFDGSAIREFESEDGSAIYRQFNPEYLDRLDSVEEALALFEQFMQSDPEAEVHYETRQRSELMATVAEMGYAELSESRDDVIRASEDLYSAHRDFVQDLGEDHPALKGAEFDFRAKGDEVAVVRGHANGSPLSSAQLDMIEERINEESEENDNRLLDAVLRLRETSVDYYNRDAAGRGREGIDAEGFDERFGNLQFFLEGIHNQSHNDDFRGPEDERMYAYGDGYHYGYFSGSQDIVLGRLRN